MGCALQSHGRLEGTRLRHRRCSLVAVLEKLRMVDQSDKQAASRVVVKKERDADFENHGIRCCLWSDCQQGLTGIVHDFVFRISCARRGDRPAIGSSNSRIEKLCYASTVVLGWTLCRCDRTSRHSMRETASFCLPRLGQ